MSLYQLRYSLQENLGDTGAGLTSYGVVVKIFDNLNSGINRELIHSNYLTIYCQTWLPGCQNGPG